jgi:hypothetical protein
MTVAPGLTMSSFATISAEETILWRLVGNGRYEPGAYVPLNEVTGDGRSYVEDLSFTADGRTLAVVRDISGPARPTVKAVDEWETTG